MFKANHALSNSAQVSYFLSHWYFLIKIETKSSCNNTSTTATINTSCTFPSRHVVFHSWNTVTEKIRWVLYVLCWLVRVMWHSCGLVQATWRLDSCLCFVFRGSYGKKIEFWYDQCSHGQTAFCSYVLGQIALYLQEVICGKKIRLHSYTYGCFPRSPTHIF